MALANPTGSVYPGLHPVNPLSLIREPSPLAFDLNVYSTEQAFLWDPQWHSCTGVPGIDFTADVRNVTLGAGAAISLKPALQFAQVRTERPDDGR